MAMALGQRQEQPFGLDAVAVAQQQTDPLRPQRGRGLHQRIHLLNQGGVRDLTAQRQHGPLRRGANQGIGAGEAWCHAKPLFGQRGCGYLHCERHRRPIERSLAQILEALRQRQMAEPCRWPLRLIQGDRAGIAQTQSASSRRAWTRCTRATPPHPPSPNSQEAGLKIGVELLHRRLPSVFGLLLIDDKPFRSLRYDAARRTGSPDSRARSTRLGGLLGDRCRNATRRQALPPGAFIACRISSLR
ncbi:hypothetical protein BOSP111201_04845 [Bordetella sputigena]